jgi:hypothetical protein
MAGEIGVVRRINEVTAHRLSHILMHFSQRRVLYVVINIADIPSKAVSIKRLRG